MECRICRKIPAPCFPFLFIVTFINLLNYYICSGSNFEVFPNRSKWKESAKSRMERRLPDLLDERKQIAHFLEKFSVTVWPQKKCPG